MVFSCFRTAHFGSFAVIWTPYKGKPRIIRILLSRSNRTIRQKVMRRYPNATISSNRTITALVDRMEKAMKGKNVRIPLSAVRLDLCSPFQRRVLRAGHAIPRGKTETYSGIARRIGNPRAGRAVGAALAGNPFPLIIPCHRVIRSNGALGGFQEGLAMKRTLLTMEGNEVTNG